jgi:TonB family protein
MHRSLSVILRMLLPAVARAQAPLSGVIVEDRAKHPLACVDVALADSAGTVLARTQTSADGAFLFAADGAAARVIRVSAHRIAPTELPLGGAITDSDGVRRLVVFLDPMDAGAPGDASDDVPPLPVRGFIAPKYPDALRPSRVQGSAVVGFAVDARGRTVRESVVELQSSHPAFLESAVEAVKGASFRPARRGGKAACAFTIAVFQFDHR